MKKIDPQLAHQCIKKYESTMKKFGVDTPARGFTSSVGFNKKVLQDWMQTLGKDTHEIKIFFGVYPELSSPGQIKKEKAVADRFTTILWPYNAKGEPAKDDDGEEELPVNAGELEP